MFSLSAEHLWAAIAISFLWLSYRARSDHGLQSWACAALLAWAGHFHALGAPLVSGMMVIGSLRVAMSIWVMRQGEVIRWGATLFWWAVTLAVGWLLADVDASIWQHLPTVAAMLAVWAAHHLRQARLRAALAGVEVLMLLNAALVGSVWALISGVAGLVAIARWFMAQARAAQAMLAA